MITTQPLSEYEHFKEKVREYETIYGTATWTGDTSRDEEYRKLREKLADLRRKSLTS